MGYSVLGLIILWRRNTFTTAHLRSSKNTNWKKECFKFNAKSTLLRHRESTLYYYGSYAQLAPRVVVHDDTTKCLYIKEEFRV
jgi:hypothetical protein